MNRIIVAAVMTAVLGSAACTSVTNQLTDVVFIPNGNSERQAGEQVEIELAFSENLPADDPYKSYTRGPSESSYYSLFGGPGSTGTRIADFALSQIGTALKNETSRYQATYSADAVGDNFYHSDVPMPDVAVIDNDRRPYSDIKLAGFKFDRMVEGRSGEPEVAMSVCSIVLPGRTDKFFYVVPVSYQMRYSKAKLIGFDVMSPFGVDLLNPWEVVTNPLTGKGYSGLPADNDLDMEIAIGFEYLHYLPTGEVTSTNVGPQNFSLKNVPVTGQVMTGYFPKYREFFAQKGGEFELTCHADLDVQKIADVRDKILSLTLSDRDRMRLISGARNYASAPRTNGDNTGNGNFTLRVAITELDDYGKRVEEISSAFDESKADARGTISSWFD